MSNFDLIPGRQFTTNSVVFRQLAWSQSLYITVEYSGMDKIELFKKSECWYKIVTETDLKDWVYTNVEFYDFNPF